MNAEQAAETVIADTRTTSDIVNGQRIRLFGWSDKLESPVLSGIFGEMVRRSAGIIEHYHGDLYHDARWIHDNVTGPCSFYWTPRECGTYVGIYLPDSVRGGSVLYRVTVECDHGVWYVTFDTDTES